MGNFPQPKTHATPNATTIDMFLRPTRGSAPGRFLPRWRLRQTLSLADKMYPANDLQQ